MNLKLSTISKISMLVFSMVILCATIWFISCKGKNKGGGNIAATSANSKFATVLLVGHGDQQGYIAWRVYIFNTFKII